MRLLRNDAPGAAGKYDIIDRRTGEEQSSIVGDPNEFFVIKCKDRHAAAAFQAYADSIRAHDPEFAADMDALAARSGPNHPNCKQPD